MQNPEIYNEVIDLRAQEAIDVQKELLKVANNKGRAEALQQVAALEGKTTEEVLERIRAITEDQREAKKKGEQFMTSYTMRVRSEASEYGADPSRYAALRTRAEINLDSLG